VLDADPTSPEPGGADALGDRLEALRDEQKQVCHDIGAAKRRGESADDLIEQNRLISQQIDALVEQEHVAQEAEHDKTAAAGPLTVSIESSSDAFRDLREEWDELLLSSDCDSPFLTWEWLYTWWEVYGGDKELYLVLVRSPDGKLVGAAPLMIGYRDFRQPKRLHRRTLAFLGTGECLGPNYLKFIAAPDREAEVTGSVLDRVAEDAGRWDIALLRHVPCEWHAGHVLAKLAAHQRLCVHVGPAEPCVWGTLPASFDEYIRAVPAERRRSYLRNQDKRLRNRFGRVSYSTCETMEWVVAYVQTLIELHLARFARKGEQSAWEDPDVYTLMTCVAQRFHERGWVCLDKLTLDGEPAGALMGFLFKGTYFLLQSGLLPRFAHAHPTHALYRYRIERLIDGGVERFDFLGAPHGYKKQYFRGRRYVTTLTVFSDGHRDAFKAGWRLAAQNAAPALREWTKRLLRARRLPVLMSEEVDV